MRKSISAIFFLVITIFSCDQVTHFHNGNYEASLPLFDVKIRIDGNTIYVDNSLTGQTKFKCVQYQDRIEYPENDGTTRIIQVLKNGNLKVNGMFEIKKIN